MRKLLSVSILIMLLVAGCNSSKNINGVEYGGYGVFNSVEKKNPDICYEFCAGNIIWSFLLVETIVAPVYFVGFSLYEPVGLKDKDAPKGSLDACN